MNSTLILDEKYSTTRLLTQEKLEIINNPEEKFATVLFLPIGENRKGEGGLRTKGYFKKSYEDKPLISIITVVFNGEKYLEETIQSVINQTYDNVEYIIIDGSSTDGTLDIIKKYEEKIDYWISEQDKGIYDAMNKGIDLASCDWINFMNAGDGFYNDKVLENIFTTSSFSNIDVLYGDYNVVYSNKTRIAKAGETDDFWKGSQICHQSAFVKTKIHKANKFNITNNISAEFENFYFMYKNNYNFYHLNLVMTNYLAGGVSDINRVKAIVSFWNVVDKNTKVNLYYICIILKEIFKDWVKRVVGR